jgi:phospholipid/cholesterol/gamma-HCH transport system substrate-binding protein
MKGKTLGAAIKLIIFAVITTVSAALLGVVISNKTFGPTNTYKAVFSDVTDLISGNDVRMAGVRVGTVKSIGVVPVTINNQTVDQAEVTFTVDNSVPISDSTRVEVHYLNLVGQRYVDLIETPAGAADGKQDPTVPIGCSTTLPGDDGGPTCIRDAAAQHRTAPAVDLTALFNGFKPLFQALTPRDVNKFSLEIVKTLQGEGGTVESLIRQTASLTKTVANRDAVIGQVIDNLLTVLNTVEKRNAGLDETITQLQRLVTGLAGDRDAIAGALGNIDKLATSSTGFVSGIRPYLPKDLKSLQRLAHNLNTTKDVDGTGSNALAAFLDREPAKLTRITRTATYGGYFNFWLCELDVENLPFKIVPTNQSVSSPSCPAAS